MKDSSGSDKAAAGLAGVKAAIDFTLKEAGPLRGTQALRKVNQVEGFDCPGCAWPEAPDRSFAEFCENGAKAVAFEATSKRLDAEFFDRWSVEDLLGQTDHWLEGQGRLTQPLLRRDGASHFEPITWDEAFERIAKELNAAASPNEAVFYTSGRTSNEAAFLYQLFVRMYGTNNLPDCSNMCHESSGTGLSETIGIGKGTVGLDDFEKADAIFVIGQNPGTNHPRMLTALEKAKRRGCRIVAVNPLRERGLVRFSNPQDPRDLLTGGTELAELFLQVRIGGDVALLKGVMKHLFELEQATPGQVLDHEFITAHTDGFDELRQAVEATSWEAIEAESGIEKAQLVEAAEIYARAPSTIICWAMGITQHKNGVANVREIANLLLLRGNVGRPGAGACPVRGHSNVQGDRTMGIWEKPKDEFLDRLEQEFGFAPPRDHGFDTIAALEAMEAGKVRVFVAMGGNFAVAAPDTELASAALQRCELTAHVATKLNRTHLLTGREGIILPCLGRTEADQGPDGTRFVTVEDSMSMVHRSQGSLTPASSELRSEPEIVAGLAQATFQERTETEVDNKAGDEASSGAKNAAKRGANLDWLGLGKDYDRIRDHISHVIPGFEDFNRRVRDAGGFRLPNGARDRDFKTDTGSARFTVNPLVGRTLAANELLLMTLRSHDQFNTTIYGLDDRYRGITGERRVIFLNPKDVARLGLSDEMRVDITSRTDGRERTVLGFRVVSFDIPIGSAGAYFPEANGLVALGDFADGSRTPAYKSIVVTLTPSAS